MFVPNLKKAPEAIPGILQYVPWNERHRHMLEPGPTSKHQQEVHLMVVLKLDKVFFPPPLPIFVTSPDITGHLFIVCDLQVILF